MCDSAQHFLNQLERIAEPEYCPSIQDLLCLRNPTLGVVEVAIFCSEIYNIDIASHIEYVFSWKWVILPVILSILRKFREFYLQGVQKNFEKRKNFAKNLEKKSKLPGVILPAVILPGNITEPLTQIKCIKSILGKVDIFVVYGISWYVQMPHKAKWMSNSWSQTPKTPGDDLKFWKNVDTYPALCFFMWPLQLFFLFLHLRSNFRLEKKFGGTVWRFIDFILILKNLT